MLPAPEFGMFVKSYIRSKISVTGKLKRISLTVLSEKPLDEERFRSAVSNWIQDEKEELSDIKRFTIPAPEYFPAGTQRGCLSQGNILLHFRKQRFTYLYFL